MDSREYLMGLWKETICPKESIEKWIQWCEETTKILTHSSTKTLPEYEWVYRMKTYETYLGFKGDLSNGMLLRHIEDVCSRKTEWLRCYGKVPEKLTVITAIPLNTIEIGLQAGSMRYFLKLMKQAYLPSVDDIENLWYASIIYSQDINTVIRALGAQHPFSSLASLVRDVPLRTLTLEEIGFLKRDNYSLAAKLMLGNWEAYAPYGSLKDSVTALINKREQAEVQQRYEWEQLRIEQLIAEYSKSDSAKKTKDYNTIPYALVEVENYRMYRTSDNDPRNLFLGSLVGCCQHPEGEGSSCAYHGQYDPEGAFFVVEKDNRVIAQSWAWIGHIRGRKVLVFDSIETLAGHRANPKIARLYAEISKKLIGRFGISQVNVGEGYIDTAPISILKEFSVTTPSQFVKEGPKFSKDIVWYEGDANSRFKQFAIRVEGNIFEYLVPAGTPVYSDAECQRVICIDGEFTPTPWEEPMTSSFDPIPEYYDPFADED